MLSIEPSQARRHRDSLFLAARSASCGVFLIGGWLVLFTIGSQLPSEPYEHTLQDESLTLSTRFHAVLMLLMTSQVSSICLLSVLGSCLGTWRRRNQYRIKTGALDAYISASITGLVCGFIVQGFPACFSAVLPFSRDQNTYSVFALVASYIGFVSGYDHNFFDGLVERARTFLQNRSKVDQAITPTPRVQDQPVSAVGIEL